jgi:hypothetical protein
MMDDDRRPVSLQRALARRPTEPLPPPRYTRWRSTPTSFGAPFKIAATALLVTYVVWGALNLFFYPYLMSLLVVWVVLRDLWRPGRIR